MTAHDLATSGDPDDPGFPEYYHYYSQMDYEFNNIKQGNRNPLLIKEAAPTG